MKKGGYILAVPILFFLALLQTSFLVHFSIYGIVPNLIIIIILLLNLMEKQKGYLGIFSAIVGGLFLDIFSSGPIGFYTIILVLISLFLKFYLKSYVRIPFIEKI